MIRFGLFSDKDYSMLKKTVIFYSTVSSKIIDMEFNLSNIDKVTQYKIRTDLYPVLRKTEKFDLESARKNVRDFLADLLVLRSEEKEYLQAFKQKRYLPELLFDDPKIIKRISRHPMALWKTEER
jgi:hypothetical protein